MEQRVVSEKLIVDAVRKYAARDVEPQLDVLRHYPLEPLPERVPEGLVELGLLGVLTPAELGGIGGDVRLLSVVMETLSATAAAPATMLLAHCLAETIALEAELDSVASDARETESAEALLAYPLYTEPTVGAPWPRLQRAAEGATLEGELPLVVNAPLASLLVVPAVDTKTESPVLVAICSDAEGVTVGDPALTLGMRGCPTADVSFHRASIAPGDLMAQDDRAGEVVRWAAGRMRGPACAMIAGIVRASLETAVSYAKERVQGGCAIIEHEQVRAMIASMVAEHALCVAAAEQLTVGDVADATGASVFVRAKDAAVRATSEGVQLLGGYGYMEDYPQEQRLRDARQAASILGRADPMRQTLIDEWLSESAPLPHIGAAAR